MQTDMRQYRSLAGFPVTAWLFLTVVVLLFQFPWSPIGSGNAAGAGDGDSVRMEVISVDDISIGEFAELLTRSGAIQVIASRKAETERVSLYLSNVTVQQALKAGTRRAGLMVQESTEGIYHIVTREEHSVEREIYKEETVETVQLKYSDTKDIGESLRNLFADRVVWIRPSESMGDDQAAMDRALSRMDRIAGRAKHLESGGGTGVTTTDRDRRTRDEPGRDTDTVDGPDRGLLEDYRDLMRLHAVDEDYQFDINLVFVSAFPPTNVMMLRSNDADAVREIKRTIEQLDRPKPQVLLEVRVMELDVGDGRSMGIDWLFERSDFYAGQSSWEGGSFQSMPADRHGADVLESVLGTQLSGATGHSPRTAILGHLSDRIRARIRLMESEGKLQQLATPTLMVANNEASQVFIGSQSKFLDSVESEPTIDPDTGRQVGTVVTPNISDRDIGMTLLLTPKIHADRSVTLRVLQEETDFGQPRTLDYGVGSLRTQNILQRSVVSTIVAEDRNWVVIGGLIREREEEKRSRLPIISRIPLLGRLFRSEGQTSTRSELLILIRPSVIIAPGEGGTISDEVVRNLSEHEALFTPARPVGEFKPEIPASAQVLGQKGKITVQVSVDEKGNVGEVEITRSSGRVSLDRAAVQAAEEIEFEPATMHGEPVASSAILEHEFK